MFQFGIDVCSMGLAKVYALCCVCVCDVFFSWIKLCSLCFACVFQFVESVLIVLCVPLW